jgi:ferric-dicitrate binding protein FerR (iron transport regulator)
MTDQIIRKLIIKELKGNVSPEESQIIDKWINEDPQNRKSYDDLWSGYHLVTQGQEVFIPDHEVAWLKIKSKLSNPNQKRVLFLKFSGIAAAALLFFSLGFAVQYFLTNKINDNFSDQYSSIVVPEGQKSMVVLPDGSKAWINSGSVLKYRNSFNAKVREVDLEGEAYFEVTKDPSRMFRVNTGIIDVEVYGTAFDIKNYDDENKVEVTVETGKVGLVKDGIKLTELTKGKQAIYDEENNQIQLSSPKVDVVTAWKNNELIFDGTPFEEVIRYLERWYGVNITIEEKMKNKHNYTFRVKTESFRELMNLLKEITPLEYKIDGKNVTIRYAN